MSRTLYVSVYADWHSEVRIDIVIPYVIVCTPQKNMNITAVSFSFNECAGVTNILEVNFVITHMQKTWRESWY